MQMESDQTNKEIGTERLCKQPTESSKEGKHCQGNQVVAEMHAYPHSSQNYSQNTK